MLLDGLHIPLTTPFYPDGRLNLRKLEHNVDRYAKTPAAGMVVLGWTGEATTLSDRETHESLATAIAAAVPEKVMLAGAARDGVAAVLDIAEDAAALGYDGILLGLPVELRGSARHRETLTWFQTVGDRSALPLVLSSSGLGLEIIAELAAHRNVLAVVERSGQADRIAAIRAATANVKGSATVTSVFAAVTGRMLAKHALPLAGAATFIGAESLRGGGTAVAVAEPVSPPALRTRLRETGFQVLVGSTAAMLRGLREGALGTIPAMAACAPQACFEVLAGWKDGDQGLAEEKQHRLLTAAARMEGEMPLGAIKYACDLNGYFGGTPRLPSLPLSGAERREIEESMRSMRN